MMSLFLYFTFLLIMHISEESTSLFIEDGGWMDVCELFDVLPSLHLIWSYSKSLIHTLFLVLQRLGFQHSPLTKFILCVCLIKNSPKNPVEKRVEEKKYITCIAYVAPVASLKTLHEKTQWKKLINGKRV
jgi:hypothetical protein